MGWNFRSTLLWMRIPHRPALTQCPYPAQGGLGRTALLQDAQGIGQMVQVCVATSATDIHWTPLSSAMKGLCP